jgi:GntR family transcriptional regulator, transcriptional repressor for pyruvate dehydrogenase complex
MIIMFVNAKSNKICDDVAGQIRQAILDGRLKPGDKLPSEKELIGKFRVSRGTLREALRSLEGLGVLDIRQGATGGPYVTEIGLDRAKDNFISYFQFKNLSIQDLVEVRLMLEPSIAAKVATRITSEDLERLKELNRKCSRTIRQQVSGELHEDFLEFHRVIASVTGNPILTFLLDVIKNLPVVGLDTGRKPTKAFAQYVLKGHVRIYEALKEGSPEKAREEMTGHVLALQSRLEERGKLQGVRSSSDITV